MHLWQDTTQALHDCRASDILLKCLSKSLCDVCFVLTVQGNELGQQTDNVHVIMFTFFAVLHYFESLPVTLLC